MASKIVGQLYTTILKGAISGSAKNLIVDSSLYSGWREKFVANSVAMNATKEHIEGYCNLLECISKMNRMIHIRTVDTPKEAGIVVLGGDRCEATLTVKTFSGYGLLLELSQYVPTDSPDINETMCRLQDFQDIYIHLHFCGSDHSNMRGLVLEGEEFIPHNMFSIKDNTE